MKRNDLDRYPYNGTFELTARCNLQCKMCMIRIDNDRMAELGGRERTAEEWIRMAEEVREAGTLGLLLTGGEPMLRRDFTKIYHSIAQMGFILTLYTNATLVTSEIMDLLKAYPPHEIGITVYGASPATYEKVTGNANAYYSMLKGVDQLSKLPSLLNIRTTIIRDNIGDLDNIADWADSLGRDIELSISRLVTKPVRGGTADVEACRLTPEENVAMMERKKRDYILKPLEKLIADKPEFKENARMVRQELYKDKACFGNDELKLQDIKPSLYGCSAGMQSYAITWDGKLVGCQLLGDCWTFPFQSGFKKAWSDYPDQVSILPKPKNCNNCNINCNACAAVRLAETGASCGFPEYVCRESKLTDEMNRKLIGDIERII